MKYYRSLIFLFGLILGISLQANSQVLADQMQKEVSAFKLHANIQLLDLQKKVDIKANNETLKHVLEQIEQKTGADLVYRNELVDKYNNVNINEKNQTVKDVLNLLLKDTNLMYLSTGSYIIIREKPAPMTESAETVSGTVTDSKTGNTMPGVNISVLGTTTGTSTDANGNYSLSVPSLQDTLSFSFVGYQTLQVPISGRTKINVSMNAAAISGEEVVVVGYGQQQHRDVTSSISSVSADEIANEPAEQVAQTLQGKVSGVEIMQNSGNPGSSFMVRIRGIGSVNDKSTQPLYVVDGNPMADPSDIATSQIKSIDVLKSASATAIYGARGANGVVMITTKNGKAREGVQFNVNAYNGVEHARRVPFVDAQNYAMLYNEALTNGGDSPKYPNPQQYGKGTDWQDVAYRPGQKRNVNVSISGGNDASTYYVAGEFQKELGVVRTTNYDRLNLRVNSHHEITDYLQIGENISFSRSHSIGMSTYSETSFFARQIASAPTAPVKNPDGSWGQLPHHANLEAMFERRANEDNGTERPVLTGSGDIELTPLKNLTLKSQYNFTYGRSMSRNFTPEYFISTTDRNELSSISRSESNWNNWDWDNTVDYKNTFGKHNIEVLAGITAQKNFTQYWSASANTLPGNSSQFKGLRYLGMAESGQSVDGNGTGYSMLSYLGRINYNYNDTYLATINYRIDGSSKFGPNNRYGYFPSFSLGWRISNESFLKDVDFINNLMLRGGWGKIGNQEPLNNYAYASSVTRGMNYYFNGNWVPGQAPQGSGNPNLKWEAIQETNLGLSFTGFDNTINVDLDYYHKTTTDMLMRVPIVAYSGIVNPPFKNSGEVVNKGLELSVGYQRTTPGDFYYSIDANVSHNTNKVTQLANNVDALYGVEAGFIGSGYLTQAQVGQPIAAFYGYVADGIFQNQSEVNNHAAQPGAAPGDLRFKDLNNDGQITADDETMIGNPWPDYSFGLTANFSYKNFDLNLGLTGQYGNDIFAAWKWTWYGGNWFNYHKNALNRWTHEGQKTDIPRLNINDPNGNLRASSWYIEDGSYLRLNNLQLGYTLPNNIIQNVRKLRIYVTATNLLTITGYPGQDPELGTQTSSSTQQQPMYIGIDWGHYAVPSTYTIGINIGL